MSKKKFRREQARLRGMEEPGPSEEKQETAAEHTSSPSEKIEHSNVHNPQHHIHKSTSNNALKRFYEDHYKTLLLIPFIILALAMVQIGMQVATTGDFVDKGVSLKGGITLTLPDIKLQQGFEQQLKSSFPGNDIHVRTLSSAGKAAGLLIEADITDEQDLTRFQQAVQENLQVTKDQYSLEIIGSSLGESFFRQTFKALIIAFICMGLVVFIYFRTLVPSLAVILAAFSDMIITLAVINVMGMKLSTAGIAAFLMLIGYSIDTDILLSTRVLKRREGTVMDGIYSAMGTGMTMTVTTLVAVSLGLIFAKSAVLSQIMTIILIGLIIDIMNTWLQNTGLLRLYLEKKKQ
jgi:preprotein translocase subunit SecF